MKMYRKLEPQGQVLVIVALSLVVLVAIVALAVDVGNIYAGRRKMQNAADAGALAGAYEICHGDPDNAEATAKEYTVVRNGAMGAEITVHALDSGDPISVTVVATETAKTFFAGIIGIHEADITAEAAAICGKAKSAGLVWPISYSLVGWQKAECYDQIILWQDGKAKCGSEHLDCCKLYEDKNSVGQPDITLSDCSEGIPDNRPLDDRTWVDFSASLKGLDPCEQEGCGNDETRDRIIGTEKHTGEMCLSLIDIPTCLASVQGTQDDAWRSAEESIDEIALIPIYDPSHSGKDGDDGVCQMDYPPGTGCTSEWYAVVELGCVQIDGPYYMRDFDKPTVGSGVRIILVHIPCVKDDDSNDITHPKCSNLLGSSDGTIPEPGDIRAVSLIK